jgi:hypothetical protein
MIQFVAVMEKLIQMIAMLKMQVSLNGLKVSVNEKQKELRAIAIFKYQL